MKSERRHELQTNTLARQLNTMPEMARQYANKVLLGVILVLLVFVLINFRRSRAEQRQREVSEALATAQTAIRNLPNVAARSLPPDQIVSQWNQLAAETSANIDLVAEESDADDAATRAQALLARGDLNWTMANLPALPGATTQPSLRLPTSKEDYLKAGEDAYNSALTTFGNRPDVKATALFSLAAIAENRRDWEKASALYKQLDTEGTIRSYRELAQTRLKMLDDLKTPMLIGSLTTKPAGLTPTPEDIAASQPTTAPATPARPAPTVQPSATTEPSTQPVK